MPDSWENPPVIAKPTRQDWLLLIVLGVMWGTSYVWIKVAVDNGLSTFTLISARLGIGLALLASVALIRGIAFPRNPRIYGHLLVMAVINIVIPFTLITTGRSRSSSSASPRSSGTTSP